MNIRIYCYDLVGVDSKTLVPFVLFCFGFVLFMFFFYLPKSNCFGTRLGFN
jgi:hypothetical protein